jgi:hypothetical protein
VTTSNEASLVAEIMFDSKNEVNNDTFVIREVCDITTIFKGVVLIEGEYLFVHGVRPFGVVVLEVKGICLFDIPGNLYSKMESGVSSGFGGDGFVNLSRGIVGRKEVAKTFPTGCG